MQVFISSAHKDGRTEGDTRYLELRRKIERLGLRPRLDPWIAEYMHGDLVDRGWRAIVDTCVHALHGSDLMIVMLFRRLGNAIEIDELGLSPVSHLEIELFHAGLRRIPVIFFQADDFDPDPELAAMVELLKRITPPSNWLRVPEREIEREVLDTLRYLAEEGQLPARLKGFCDALSDRRSFKRVDAEIGSSRLSFLSGFAPGISGPVSIDRVDLLLSEAEQLTGAGQDSFVGRLSRLWMALRDLAQQPLELLDAELAGRWLRLCELWTNSAAWLHLHGPLELGVLATLHTRVDLQMAGFISERNFPFGAFASEAYSIAKISDNREWQCRRFAAARNLATRQIAVGKGDGSGAYGIRASAAMQLARRGSPWLAASGMLDYHRMLAIREKVGASRSEIGEAQVELGFAQFTLGRHLPWTRDYALEQLREGVHMLEEDQPTRRAGFVKRGKRKLAEALETAGMAEEAAVQRCEIEVFAKAQGLPVD